MSDEKTTSACMVVLDNGRILAVTRKGTTDHWSEAEKRSYEENLILDEK